METLLIKFAIVMSVAFIFGMGVLWFTSEYGATWPGLFKNLKRLFCGQKLVKHAIKGGQKGM